MPPEVPTSTDDSSASRPAARDTRGGVPRRPREGSGGGATPAVAHGHANGTGDADAGNVGVGNVGGSPLVPNGPPPAESRRDDSPFASGIRPPSLRERILGTMAGPFRRRHAGDGVRAARNEQPLRGDLYSVDQLAQHSRTLAGWHETGATVPVSSPLLLRLADNQAVLEDTYGRVVRAAEKGRRIAPAAEWLIDNYYLIEEQIRLARKHLPSDYARQLPRLRTGPSAGRPRVYDIALELISHVDGRVDSESLEPFIASYQSVEPLHLGELWAVPIMLRLALIENLRRVAARIAAGQNDQDLAHAWSQKIISAGRKDPKSVVRVLADMYEALGDTARSGEADAGEEPANVTLSTAFVAEFSRRMAGQGPAVAFPMDWVTQVLAEQGQTVEGLVQAESQRQAADQVSIGNSISSLRFLESCDWRTFVEDTSAVERVLREDPADVHARQDFGTRDAYRHEIEVIARRSPLTEVQVAETLLRLASRVPEADPLAWRKRHIGYWLVDEGRPTLERDVETRPTFGQRLGRAGRRAPLGWYVLSVVAWTLVLALPVLWWSAWAGWPWWTLLAIGLPVVLAASQWAVGLTNWLVTNLVPPRPLSRLDMRDGIPPGLKTAVVVPAMLSDRAGVDALVEGVEVRFLANRDPHLVYVLLTDWPDADVEQRDPDAALLDHACVRVADLGRRYGFGGGHKFLLLHRPRLWNASEGVWMGWERKRGKLTQFNRLLDPPTPHPPHTRPAAGPDFVRHEGDLSALEGVRYVITLDADTDLPRDSAAKLVGTAAHPLNKPVFDDATRRVVKGYGILQPRVDIDLPSAGRSVFARLMSGEPGLDPYTRAVSDVYQDAFGEGSFVGKGLYDPRAFEKALDGRFPENAILSHDLIESAFARSGLVSDVTLYEDHPASYLADVARRHRWVRGDWQILDYVLPWNPGGPGALSRWKIFDNLRRSLVPPAVFAALVVAWVLWPTGAVAWTGLLFAYFFVPPLAVALVALSRRPAEHPFRFHVRDVGTTTLRHLGRAALGLVTLPFEAHKHTDAVVRTLWRRYVSRRHLLEWVTMSDAEVRTRRDQKAFWEAMAPAWIGAAVFVGAMGVTGAAALFSALPLLVLWFVSPTLAWAASHPLPPRRAEINQRDRNFLRKLSRRTWSFFEQFVGAADNFLPPDNYQELPREAVANRTSPTNIGLGLLSNLAAHDFGYVTLGQFLDRTERTMASVDRLERMRGHLLNWYDTTNLEPLPPRYVSTVDSGNFVGCVHVLKVGLRELADRPAVGPQAFRGLEDSVRIFLDTCRGLEKVTAPGTEGTPRGKIKLSSDLTHRLESLMNECAAGGPARLGGAKLLLSNLTITASQAVAAVSAGGHEEARRWAGELERHATRFAEELHHLCPWVDLVGPSRAYAGNDRSSRDRLALLDRTLIELETYPSLRQVARLAETVVPALDRTITEVEAAAVRGQADVDYFRRARRILADAADRCASRIRSLELLAERCDDYTRADWSLLYDRSRHLLHIGYNVADRRLDVGYYDLLASEMRLGSFVLVATGELPQEHWFSMGRNLTTSGNYAALLSWSGSMFEYLMPLLVMPTYEGTLLDQTYKGVVRRQIEYARQHGNVPWGISESGYNATDAQLNYQYRPFGVPGLGYKRGLGEDLVIAPYATVMATMVEPGQAVANLRRLRDEGKLGRYGFFEAVDYTPARVKRGESEATVRSFMVHHQGMGFLALAYLLLDSPMQKRMMSDPQFRSSELLLHEKVPRAARVFPHAGEHAGSRRLVDDAGGTLRIFRTPHTVTPEVHLLSNGRLTTMVTAAGGGFVRYHGLAVTRWREDAVRDADGPFLYVRDVETGQFWSNTYQPTLKRPERYDAIFSQARAEFRRIDRIGDDGEVEVHTQISVSPEDDVEVRRVTLTNNTRKARTLEVTSYAEVVLTDPKADAAHPAFQNLFVQTRLVRGRQAIIAKRRPRSAGERTPFVAHLVVLHTPEAGTTQYETDRSAFIGRGRTLADPAAMHADRLGDSQGSVLDPIVSVRRAVRLEPGEAAKIDVVTGIADTHEEAHALIEKYHDRRLNDRVAELAWTHSQIVLRQLGAAEEDAQLYGRLAGSVIFASPPRRATGEVVARNTRKQSNLWAYGISGDLPIVLLRVSDHQRSKLVEQTVQAHAYWRRKGLACDLVVWNEDTSGYRAEMHEAILSAVSAAGESGMLDKPGGIFIRRAEQFQEEDKVLVQSLARVILTDKAGSLAEQIDRRGIPETQVPRLTPTAARPKREPPVAAELSERKLDFHNGIGGFSADGREYVTVTTAETPTPAPWCNVLANADFGCLLSESGVGYTWAVNAREFRLTPWYNDPVSDKSGEALYVRDDESGRFWSPTPLPARGAMPYVTRHGFGYSVFEYAEHGIASEATAFVHPDLPVRYWLLRLRNTGERRRRLSVTDYAEWVLGDFRHVHAQHVTTSVDPKTGAVLARNPYNADFDAKTAFLRCSEPDTTVTGDRFEFFGRNGSPEDPAAMHRTKLSGRVGAALDPCAAVRCVVDLAPGEEKEIVFTLGAADADAIPALLAKAGSVSDARKALADAVAAWETRLGTLRVRTPEPAADVLVNGWLEYQVLACRYWGRTGFYQSGGAYGFRDQLQDVAALAFAEPSLIREHLLRAARHQFREGDVQHWWHPPGGKGVRTHFSDDYLWLPLVAARYVAFTGDAAALDEHAPFLEGRAVPPDQESVYDQFDVTSETADLYEHCRRAILYGVKTRGYGRHGLPLMGCGDWNDGMNLVGEHGKGESVWLAWFFVRVFLDFIPLAAARGDDELVDLLRDHVTRLRDAVENHAWDGNWYKRAYFDNGEPLGSHTNPECQIDSLPQSWAVLSGANPDPDRVRQAMQHVDARLVRRDAKLIQLFDPPFDASHLEPGYIKGYVPGVRENGGQYTHAAIWTVMAFAELGDDASVEKAWDLFRLINPVLHAADAAGMTRYKVEPYVLAADVYGVEPHVGRGGWTWYTGSAGWMYRLATEHLLGITVSPGRLHVDPKLPADWDGFEFTFHTPTPHPTTPAPHASVSHPAPRRTTHEVRVVRVGPGTGVRRVLDDGRPQPDPAIDLRDDGGVHRFTVEIGTPPA